MYAIVEINGQQFKAEEGKKLFVHHIQNAEANQAVEFEKVLLVDNNGNVTVGAPTVEGAKVVCEVVSPLVKGDKVGQVTWDQVREIAQDKMPDMNCFTLESAMRMVAGTARSMGINVVGEFPNM